MFNPVHVSSTNGLCLNALCLLLGVCPASGCVSCCCHVLLLAVCSAAAVCVLLLSTCPAGTRYVSGAVLRVIRSYPGDYDAHVISADGATQVGQHTHSPTRRGVGFCRQRDMHTLLVFHQLSKPTLLACPVLDFLRCCCCYFLPPPQTPPFRPLAALQTSPPTSSLRLPSSQPVRQRWRYSGLHARPAA